MHTSLVIVESPAKCKKIEAYLGPGYKVMASFGHLRCLSGLEAINIKDDFQLTFSIIQEELKLKQIEKLRSEIAKADDVIIATDDDREGEAIGWHICDLFGLNIADTKRIIFHEITEPALQSAISHPKRLNMELVKAQQARQILDLLVGFTISPILWDCVSKTHDTSLSAGRCQTPALRLIYENYLDIKSSSGKLVYNTIGYFTNLILPFELNKDHTNVDECRQFLEECKTWTFLCSTMPPKKVFKKTPEPLTTSSLQQLASNELHLSPKDTMKYAQQLYENGYITYMRTDSKKYSQDFIDKVKIHIATYYGDQFVSQGIDQIAIGSNPNPEPTNNKCKKSAADRKGIPAPQEAHEAIRPVNIGVKTPCLEESLIQGKAIKLYELIWKHTLESCMASAQYNSIVAKINAPQDTEFVYKTEQVLFLGWQIVNNVKKESDKENGTYSYIANLKQNIAMSLKKIDSKFTMKELKSHYSEARLIQLLEEKGIGRPSTFASLVDKIQERKYVLKENIHGRQIEHIDLSLSQNTINETITKKEFGNEKNKLVIQPLGIIVIEFLLDKFEMFFNYEYTGTMEQELDLIANGQHNWITTCEKCHNELTNKLDTLHDIKKFSIVIDDEHSLIIGKHGPVIKCVSKKNPKKVSFLPVKKNLDIEKIKHIDHLTLEDVMDNNVCSEERTPIGKYRGQDLYVKQGKYGVYAQWGKETKSLKEAFSSLTPDKINYIDVIRFLDKDSVLDPEKPVGFVRELNEHLSIRTGKYGDYIFYKKPRIKTPQFFKLNGFDLDYKKCDKALLLNWIKQTYNVE